ncbi:MAG: iron-sulfur cluster assembly accessory protein [Elusimicrobiota bacterium]
MITCTRKAADKITSELAKQGRPGGCLRVYVTYGGCAGLNYEFEFIGAPDEEDVVSEENGVRIAVDPRSDFFLDGAVVHWHQTLMGCSFRVKNPNAVDTCGCGTSFSTPDTDESMIDACR